MANEGIVDWNSDDGSSNYAEDEPAYEVERILAERQVSGKIQYLVKWADFGDEDCTWEPPESFDQTSSISLWEEARDRGDSLDAMELREVEKRMARHRAEQEKRYTARDEKAKQKAAPTGSSTNVVATEKPTAKGNNPSQKGTLLCTDLNLIPSQAKILEPMIISPPALLNPPHPTKLLMDGHNRPRQEFHGLGNRQVVLRGPTQDKHNVKIRGQDPAKRYRNLSHQNNDQKRRKQEPPPNIKQIGKLLQASELVSRDDVALNLPTGPPRLTIAANQTREKFIESPDGQLERVLDSQDGDLQGTNVQLTKKDSRKPNRSACQHLSQPLPPPNSHLNSDVKLMRFDNELLPYKWGELVVRMSFGQRMQPPCPTQLDLIGHVKICGLAHSLIAALLRRKQGPILTMFFEQEDVLDLQDYISFAREVGFSGSGFIEPFENAKDAFAKLLTSFNAHSRTAGVWFDASSPWILIIYSSTAEVFVQQDWPRDADGLQCVACTRLPWRISDFGRSKYGQDPKNVLETMPHQDVLLRETDSSTNEPGTVDATHHSELSNPIESFKELVQSQSPTHDPRRKQLSKADRGIQKEQNQPVRRSMELEFEKKYGISYEFLTRIPASIITSGSGVGRFYRNLVRFFLAFDAVRADQEAELKGWLSSHTPGHMIFSSVREHDWERYKDGLKSADYVGIILIHEDYVNTALGSLRGLAKRVRREDVQIFQVSLSSPLDNRLPHHFFRIFPSGLVIAITEGSVLAHPRKIASILERLAKASKGKQNWKVFLRPQYEQYFEDLCEADMPEEHRRDHQNSLFHLRSLPGFFEYDKSPLAGVSGEIELDGRVLSPLSSTVYSKGERGTSLVTCDPEVVAARDMKLLDFFGGWSALQIGKFRKFVALPYSPGDRTTRELADRYNHVDFSMSCDEFLRVYALGIKDDDVKSISLKGTKITSSGIM